MDTPTIPGISGVIQIPALIDESNLPTWDRRVLLCFKYLKLLDLLQGTAQKPEPIIKQDGTVDKEATEKAEAKYEERCILAFALVRNSLDKVQDRLIAAGWDDKDMKFEVKPLYDLVHRTIPSISKDNKNGLMQELMRMNVNNYSSIQAMLNRFQWLRNRLRELGADLQDDYAESILYEALVPYDEQWVKLMRLTGSTMNRTFQDTLELVSKLANDQALQMSLAATRTSPATSSTSAPKGMTTSGNRAYCNKCHKTHWTTIPYHKACQRCHNGGDDGCWKLHPELREQSINARTQRTTTTTDSATAASSAALSWSSGARTDRTGVNNLMLAESPINSDRLFSLVQSNDLTKETVIIDSGASRHTFNDRKWYSSMYRLDQPYLAAASNGGATISREAGEVNFNVRCTDNVHTSAKLHHVVFSKESPVNILSAGQLREDGIVIDGTKDQLVLRADGRQLGGIHWVKNVAILTIVRPEVDIEQSVKINDLSMPAVDYKTMHKRLMHASVDKVIKACRDAGITINETKARAYHCKWCHLAKSTKVISYDEIPRAQRPLGRIYFDSIPHKPMGAGGYKHTIHLLDDYSRYQWVIFIKSKADGFEKTEEWMDYIENQTGLKIQIMHGDGGTEFSPAEMRKLCKKKGVAFHPIVPGSSEQNGPSERTGRTLLEYSRASLHSIGAPESDWPYAEEATIHTLNKIPSSANPGNESPHERFAKALNLPQALQKPALKYLRTWGCKAYVHIGADERRRPRGRKMMNKAIEGRLYGYEGVHGKIYRVKLQKSGKIIRVRDVRFHEEHNTDQTDETEPEGIAAFEDDYVIDLNIDQTVAMRRSLSAVEPTNSSVLNTTMENTTPSTPANTDHDESIGSDYDDTVTFDHSEEPSSLGTPDTYSTPLTEPDVLSTMTEAERDHFEAEGIATPSSNCIWVNTGADENDESESTTTSTSPEESDGTPEPRRSVRFRLPPGHYRDMADGTAVVRHKGVNALAIYQDIDRLVDKPHEFSPDPIDELALVAVSTPKSDPPMSYSEARSRADYKTRWLPAMQKQLGAFDKQHVYDLIDAKPGIQVLPGKWVYDDKYDIDGNHIRDRARWVICGNFEGAFTNPHEAYSAVASRISVRIYLTKVAIENLECYAFDYVTAYLNAGIPPDQIVYMQQPKGLEDGTDRVCLLRKALYGLKRSARWWFDTITPILKEHGFEAIDTDCCVFRHPAKGALIILYVDDMLIAAPTTAIIEETRTILANEFELKELGPVQSFLGLQVTRDRENRTIYLSQEAYVDKILAKFDKQSINPVSTPSQANLTLPAAWEPVTDQQSSYIAETASLNYLATGTRPDISFTVSKLSQANKGPSKEHIGLLNHLWRYIKGTKSLGIKLGGRSNMDLRAYSDAAFADDLLTRASTGGHVIFLAGSPILWQSKRQSLVTTSTTEAEFINLTPTARDLLWIKATCQDFGIPVDLPIVLFTDSQNARLTVLNPINQARTRYIDLRYKWVIQRTDRGDFEVVHIGTNDMVADGLTKALPRIRHAAFVKQLGLTTLKA